jgi:DNA-directed RNA polymerase sigma subunit (sigma70/sigma32)
MASENDIKTDYLQGLMKQKIKTLPVTEEHKLAELIAQGDDDALEKLVYHNLPFVLHVVTKMSVWEHSRIEQEDIISIGNEMLLKAAKRWKPYKNVPFAGYARPFIERGVRREIDNTANTIRLPINIVEDIYRMNYNEQVLTQLLGRKPNVPELAKILNCKPEKIHRLRGCVNREPISLDNLNNDNYNEEHEE